MRRARPSSPTFGSHWSLCDDATVAKYVAKRSGPLLDRVDLHDDSERRQAHAFEGSRVALATADQDALTSGWYGYGSWKAPYWFIGMEPGGDQGEANFAHWDRLGRAELLDIQAHHEGHVLDWFSESSATQSTWAKLIWLLLAYKGVEPTRDATLRYQRDRLGRCDGETALLELSALAASHMGVAVSRSLNRVHRIETIRERLRAHEPSLVVFYSTRPEYADAWARIAGARLSEGRPVRMGPTAFLMAYHPQYKRSKAYWLELAERLHAVRETP